MVTKRARNTGPRVKRSGQDILRLTPTRIGDSVRGVINYESIERQKGVATRRRDYAQLRAYLANKPIVIRKVRNQDGTFRFFHAGNGKELTVSEVQELYIDMFNHKLIPRIKKK